MTGTSREVLEAAGEAEKIDCGGKTVIPGFNDSHQHSVLYVRRCFFLILLKPAAPEDMTAMCKAYLDKKSHQQRFPTAGGWNESEWKEGARRETKQI